MARRPRRVVYGERFEGARELDRYLRENDLRVPSFCEQHGLDRFHIERLLGGKVKRSPPTDIVLDIRNATNGRVTPEMWTEESLREDTPGEVPTDTESGAALPTADDSDHDAA